MENPFPKPYPDEPKNKEEPYATGATSSAPSPIASDITEDTPSFKEYEPRISDLAEENIDGLRTSFIGAAIILVIVIAAGFGGWYFFRDKNSSDSSPSTPSLTEDNNAFVISAVSGGIIAFEDFRLIIPPGALEKDTAIEISREAPGPITDLFYLKPHGLKFLKPAEINIPYKEEGLQKGEKPKSILLEYWSGEEMKKKSILAFEVDEERKVLETEVNEL